MTTNSKEYQKAYYEANKERIKQQQREYYLKKRANPKLFDMREDYKTPTREEFKEIPTPKLSKAMEYYYANRERILEQQRDRRRREKINAKQREYYAKNKKRLREQQNKRREDARKLEKFSKSFIGKICLKIFG